MVTTTLDDNTRSMHALLATNAGPTIIRVYGPLSPHNKRRKDYETCFCPSFSTASSQHVRSSELTLERAFSVVFDNSEDSLRSVDHILPKRQCPLDLTFRH